MLNFTSRKHGWRVFLAATSSLFGAAYCGPAFAQEALPETASDTPEDTIVVTAQRREQSLQDVPISMNALSGETIDDRGIADVQDLQRVVPGLTMQTTQSDATTSTIRIRGVGTTGNNPGLEGAVGVFVDGVFRTRAGLVMNDIFDLERVEVLRGPQGTLFGKNTSAGVVSLHTHRPEFDFGAELEATYGNFDARVLRGMVNLPVSDEFAVRLSGVVNQRDGYIDNVADGSSLNDRDRTLLRGQFLFEPNNDIEWRVIADYAHKDEQCCVAVSLEGVPAIDATLTALGGTVFSPRTPFSYRVATDAPFLEQSEDMGLTSTFKWRLGDINFTNILAYRDFDSSNVIDGDFTDVGIVTQTTDGSNRFSSAEFQFDGSAGRLDWLVGLYVFREATRTRIRTLTGPDFDAYLGLRSPALGPGLVTLGLGATPAEALSAAYPEGVGSDSYFYQRTNGWAIFTHNTWHWTDNLSTTVGLRYSSEEKEGGGVTATSTPVCNYALPTSLRSGLSVWQCDTPDFSESPSEDALTGTLIVQYDFDDGWNAYASYSRGFKAGGINLDRDAAVPTPVNTLFDPEFVDSYEVGLKALLFGGDLRWNTAIYHGEYSDFQLNGFNGLTFNISNAAGVRSYGAETDVTWSPNQGVAINLGVAWNESQYTDDTETPCQRPPAGIGVGTPTSTCAGLQLTNAPNWIVTNSYDFNGDLGATEWGWFFNSAVVYRSSYNTGADLDPIKRQDAFFVVDGRVGVTSPEEAWELYLWGRNIFDEGYKVVASDAFGQPNAFTSFVGMPATYGVGVRARF